MKMKLLMERSVVRFDLEKIDFFQFEFFLSNYVDSVKGYIVLVESGIFATKKFIE